MDIYQVMLQGTVLAYSQVNKQCVTVNSDYMILWTEKDKEWSRSEMVYIGSDNDKNNLLEMKLKACELLYPDMHMKDRNMNPDMHKKKNAIA